MRYGNVELHNVCEMITDEGEDGFRIARLPVDVMENVNPGAKRMAHLSAGCEIRGMLKEGGEAKITLQALDDNILPPVATVYHGSFSRNSIHVDTDSTEITVSLPGNFDAFSAVSADNGFPFDPSLVRILLPHLHPVRILSIEGDLTYPTAEALPQKTMLSYGSSITHGAHAIPPSGTYPFHCARRLGCDTINLGVGGSAHMDPAFAEHIAGRDDWDFATFEMGINVRTWPLEKFQAAVDNFVKTIVAAHPDKYIFCIDLFTNNCDFQENPEHGLGFREAVDEVVNSIGSDKVMHLDGRDLLSDPLGLSFDLVHPSDVGMAEMGASLATAIAKTEAMA